MKCFRTPSSIQTERPPYVGSEDDMLKIRRDQLEEFERRERRRFEGAMLLHLKAFAQPHCEAIGDDGILQIIRLGLEKSNRYGFTLHGPVRLYIESMFMFGCHFDTDPQYPWASDYLNDPAPDQMFRAEGLYQKITCYLEHVVGPDGLHAHHALRQMRWAMPKADPAISADLRGEILRTVESVYPQKCAWLGNDILGHVVDKGLIEAGAHGVTSVSGMMLFPLMAFALGHGFATDPLYPWIVHTLGDLKALDANVRVERLRAQTMLFLDRFSNSLQLQ
jgi:hypothetical protein